MSEVAVVPDLRYYPEYACGLRKTMKNLGLAGTPAQIRTEHLQKRSESVLLQPLCSVVTKRLSYLCN